VAHLRVLAACGNSIVFIKILECGGTCALADRSCTRRIRLSYAGQPGEKPVSQLANLAANINDIVEQYQHTIWPDMA
jgi:hypothetical protein